MNNAQVVCLILLFLYLCYLGIWGWIKRGFRGFVYEVKWTVNGLRWLVFLVVSLYFVIISSLALPFLKAKAQEMVSTSSDVLSAILLSWIPLAFGVFQVLIVCWIMWNSVKPTWRYNQQELEWNKESDEKFRARLPHRLQRFYKGGKKREV